MGGFDLYFFTLDLSWFQIEVVDIRIMLGRLSGNSNFERFIQERRARLLLVYIFHPYFFRIPYLNPEVSDGAVQ